MANSKTSFEYNAFDVKGIVTSLTFLPSGRNKKR